MKRHRHNKAFNRTAYVVKVSALLLAVMYIGSFFIIYLVEQSGKKELQATIEEKEAQILDTSSEIFKNAFNETISDLIFIHDIVKTSGYSKEKYEKPLFLFSNAKENYDQIRIISTSGMELTRINQGEKSNILVSEENLANKGKRYYVTQGLALENNQVYLSKIDLNVENSEVEVPYKPMVRFVMPIYKNEEIWGIVVINYKIKENFDLFKSLTQIDNAKAYILNDEGYYLASSHTTKEWGFMFEDGLENTFDIDFPFAWQQIQDNQTSFSTPLGGFIYKAYDLNHLMASAKEKYGIDYIYADEPELKMVSYVPIDSAFGHLYENKISAEIGRLFKKYKLFAMGELLIILILIPLVVSRKEANAKIVEISEKDALTGLYNRGKGYERIINQFKGHHKMGLGYAICFVDVNGLKSVNDVFGHEAGDVLIKKTAEILKRYTREKDIICRFGGDEFVLGFSETDYQTSENIWACVIEGVALFNQNSQLPFIISLSHGIALSSEVATAEIDDLIQLADERMYREKKIIKENLTIIRQNGSEYVI